MTEIKMYRMELDADRHPVLVMEQRYEYCMESKMASPERIAQMCNEIFQSEQLAEEEVWLFAGNGTTMDIKALFRISHGSASASICDPMAIYTRALLSGASVIVLAHNHPSGNVNPSQEDRNICRKLVEGGKLIGIKIVDFLITGINGAYYSFAENGDISV